MSSNLRERLGADQANAVVVEVVAQEVGVRHSIVKCLVAEV